jgi:hypothetical protein
MAPLPRRGQAAREVAYACDLGLDGGVQLPLDLDQRVRCGSIPRRAPVPLFLRSRTRGGPVFAGQRRGRRARRPPSCCRRRDARHSFRESETAYTFSKSADGVSDTSPVPRSVCPTRAQRLTEGPNRCDFAQAGREAMGRGAEPSDPLQPVSRPPTRCPVCAARRECFEARRLRPRHPTAVVMALTLCGHVRERQRLREHGVAGRRLLPRVVHHLRRLERVRQGRPRPPYRAGPRCLPRRVPCCTERRPGS